MFTNNIKRIILGGFILVGSAAFTSCTFLDREPLDEVSGGKYYNSAEELSTFTINYYSTIFRNNSGWFAGVATFDDGTDNQASPSTGNERVFGNNKWSVPAEEGLNFNNIRNLNKFIAEVEAKQKAGTIAGSKEDINHNMGEAYAIRAMLYFDKLKTYGDFPILLEEVNIDADLVAASKRMPRNEVARQILKDLDKAISLLKTTTPRNQRISKRVALVWKSRVALYEGTFEKYHRNTGRVPGDAKWSGKDKEWNKGKSFDQEGEVKFFLTEAMNAAKSVADEISLSTKNNHKTNPSEGEFNGWNPYYDMYASKDLSGFPEVLLWREFNTKVDVAHLTSNKLKTGSGTGWTRGLVESFLMKSGKPIYDKTSGYKGDTSIDLTKTDRDERLQLFVFGESDMLNVAKGEVAKFKAPYIISTKETTDATGYRQRKFYNYDTAMHLGTTFTDVSGQIYVRVEEAYLNYMEASYLLNNSLDATARKYWTALRERAGITASLETTISATDMAFEADVNRPSYDWAAFSAGISINDPMLYSIRRERRCEFAGEGYRWDDLIRWRALDQVKNYQIEGVNFWDAMFNLDVDNDPKSKTEIIADGGEKANISSKEITKYLRPYQIRKNNELYNGYTFKPAYYLAPFSVQEMQLTSPTGDAANSNLYQNIGWPTYAGFAE